MEALPTVMVVDDSPANLGLMSELLKRECRVKLANSGARALSLALKTPPDLLLLDVMMPQMDGYEVCRQLKADARTRDLPVIFVSAMPEPESEALAFEVGGADFIQKPIRPQILLARVRTHLEAKAWRDALARRNAGLEAAVQHHIGHVERLRDVTMFAMVSLAEFRDDDTGNHAWRTQEYVRVLASHLRDHPGDDPDAASLDDSSIHLLAKSAALHDIGKVAMPDHILLKPGKLDADDFEVMKTHTVRGWEILDRAARRAGDSSAFLNYALQIARHHHERWDGNGYPDRLAGAAIPLSARLMALADVYDAMISRRPYKEPSSHEQAMRQLLGGFGSSFDPRLEGVLKACEPSFVNIAESRRN